MVKKWGFVEVNGNFQEFTGKVQFDGKKFITLEGRAIIASLQTGDEKRDKDLKSVKFFDIEKFPYVDFKMIKYEEETIQALVTIRGITKTIFFRTHLMHENNTLRLELKGNLDRTDFNLGKSLFIGDDVRINITLLAKSAI